MDLTLKLKGLTLDQIAHMANFFEREGISYEEVPQLDVTNPWVPNKNPWDKDLIGVPHHNWWFSKEEINKSYYCLFDGVDPGLVTMLSCNCPKCSPQCEVK